MVRGGGQRRHLDRGLGDDPPVALCERTRTPTDARRIGILGESDRRSDDQDRDRSSDHDQDAETFGKPDHRKLKKIIARSSSASYRTRVSYMRGEFFAM